MGLFMHSMLFPSHWSIFHLCLLILQWILILESCSRHHKSKMWNQMEAWWWCEIDRRWGGSSYRRLSWLHGPRQIPPQWFFGGLYHFKKVGTDQFFPTSCHGTQTVLNIMYERKKNFKLVKTAKIGPGDQKLRAIL